MVPSNYNSTLGCGLLDFMSLNNFSQFNNIPNSDGRYLDLIMSNFPGVDVSEPLELLSRLDCKHPNILVTLQKTNFTYLQPKKRTDHNFYRANYEEIASDLDCIDWVERFWSCSNVNEMVTKFYDELN
ncbi:unnamed protein product [Parnassius apollo]|uniref:(apollo) hypothetical protein n=1 Tax=Parnassius apollo TaxID=110799 RepID=A0A8S3W5I3_PARAO|nr:unnamed protein product [Parnassius apollo]